MTPHALDLIRNAVWNFDMRGPVLEIGSYIEANQEHLDMRRAFPRGTPYVGTDVIEGPGVDRIANLLDGGVVGIAAELQPRSILCLYVLEHVWEIQAAAHKLAETWRGNPPAWLWASTHQMQPYHGTDKYPDYWRITASGMKRLFNEAGLNVVVLVHADTSNPPDVVAVRPPEGVVPSDDDWSRLFRSCAVHWERYC